MFECQGWGGGGGVYKKWENNLFYRFKTECWAEDVGCADIKRTKKQSKGGWMAETKTK